MRTMRSGRRWIVSSSYSMSSRGNRTAWLPRWRGLPNHPWNLLRSRARPAPCPLPVNNPWQVPRLDPRRWRERYLRKPGLRRGFRYRREETMAILKAPYKIAPERAEYSLTLASGALTVVAAAGAVWSMQWTSTSLICVVKRLRISVGVTTAYGAAQATHYGLYFARSYT